MDGEWNGLIEVLAAKGWRPDDGQGGRCGGAAGPGAKTRI